MDVLNVYLKTRANQEQKKRLNVTYVAIDFQSKHLKRILGYYTLSNSSIALHACGAEIKKGIPVTYDMPSVKIGRLAVTASHQSKGLGINLLKDAFERIMDISALSAVRGIEVIAKTDEIARFYKKYGFVQLKDQKKSLYLPISSVVKTLDP